MEFLLFVIASILLLLISIVILAFWVFPIQAHIRLRKNGFSGPSPNFPLGNIGEMRKKAHKNDFHGVITHDIHSIAFPYFAQWRQSYGKVFIYWLGIEPFLYIGDPEFLKQVASEVEGKNWGKPAVFRRDWKALFGKGLTMVEGDEWVRHRHIIAPAFSPGNLKAMIRLMVDSTTKMVDQWKRLVDLGMSEIDVERDIIENAAEIIAKTSFGMSHQYGQQVFKRLRRLQLMLFKSNRLVGVPFNELICLKQTLELRNLGKEVDHLLLSIISSREASSSSSSQISGPQEDLLGLLLADNHKKGRDGKKLSVRELVDECKTFFFGGHETTALALSWTLMLLAQHPEWQSQLREEIRTVIGEGQPLDFDMLAKLVKMGWVMNEVLRLYPTAPNIQRQARGDIHVGDMIIPKGTNIWIDVVGLHHDPDLWGPSVSEFRPDRFKDSFNGGCKHRMGFVPFGLGGRMCVGRNLSMMEYKIVLTLILSKFSLTISPTYCHSPTIMLSFRPSHGIPLILQPI